MRRDLIIFSMLRAYKKNHVLALAEDSFSATVLYFPFLSTHFLWWKSQRVGLNKELS